MTISLRSNTIRLQVSSSWRRRVRMVSPTRFAAIYRFDGSRKELKQRCGRGDYQPPPPSQDRYWFGCGPVTVAAEPPASLSTTVTGSTAVTGTAVTVVLAGNSFESPSLFE